MAWELGYLVPTPCLKKGEGLGDLVMCNDIRKVARG